MVDEYKVIKIKQSVFADNTRQADAIRADLKARKTFLLNLMSSPGSGKTTTLTKTIAALKDEINIGIARKAKVHAFMHFIVRFAEGFGGGGIFRRHL
jgi:hypothetical protein